MRNSWRRLAPAILLLALSSCIGGGGTNDNPAAGVEPNGQSLDASEPLVNDSFDLPTQDSVDTLTEGDFDVDSTGTPDAALFGGDTGSGALGPDATEPASDLFSEANETATPGP